MLINVRKVTKLELIDRHDLNIENDENKTYWLMLRVEPVARRLPANQDEEVVDVAVHDQIARLIPEEAAKVMYPEDV